VSDIYICKYPSLYKEEFYEMSEIRLILKPGRIEVYIPRVSEEDIYG